VGAEALSRLADDVTEQAEMRDAITQRSLALAGEIKAKHPHLTVARNHDVVTAGDTRFTLRARGVSVDTPDKGVTWAEDLTHTAIVQRAWEAGLL